jgi:hypothetical protein
MPEIQTLGRFNISVDGKAVATQWPDEKMKVFFCSLLSPLDLYLTWDRISRSICGAGVTRTSRRQMEEGIVRPLNSFMITEMGFNPLIAGHDGIRIDPTRIDVDVFELYDDVQEGLRQLLFGNNVEALEKFSRADALYAGSYLPGMEGKIIENTRRELDTLYQTVVLYGTRQARSMTDH